MPGQVNVYVSTQGGDRFAFSRLPLESSSSNFSVDDDCSTNRSCLFSRNPPVVSVLVDESRQLQRIEGFGGAMTDAAAENILSLPQSLQKQVIQDYFGPDGLEYSIVRMTIGGSDFSSRQYTLDDHPDDFDLEHFALPKEDIEWKVRSKFNLIE